MKPLILLSFVSIAGLTVAGSEALAAKPALRRAISQEEGSSASPAPAAPSETELLPAFGVDRAITQAEGPDKEKKGESRELPVKVGSPVTLVVERVVIDGVDRAARALKLEAEAGPQGTPDEDKLFDQGWKIRQLPDAEGRPADEILFEAVPLKSGRLELPPLVLRDASGKAVGNTKPFTLQVESAIAKDDPNPQAPVELRDPVALQLPVWMLALLGIACVLAAGGLFYLIYTRMKGRKAETALPPVPPKPEDEVALLALSQLQDQKHAEKGSFKKHYFGVSDILKQYFEKRYGFEAAESTTGELLEKLRERPEIPQSVADQVSVLFAKLDPVKFADQVPDLAEASLVIEEARKIVTTTRKPKPVVVTNAT